MFRPKAPISPSTSLEVLLFNPDPGTYLPHRFPFLLLDRILSLEPGISAVASQLVTSGDSDFPRFFLVEAMAQLGGIAAAREEGGGGILAAIDRAEFHGPISAGDILTIAVRIIKSFGQLHLVEGEVCVGDRKLASAVLTLKVGTIS